MVKGGQLDIAKFDPVAIQQIQAYGTDKQLLALPLSMNFSLLYYNKDIFDQMGVSYPKDDMTWEQTLDLAKKLYKPGSDQKYFALDAGDITQHASSLSLPVVNAATGQAALQTDGWRKVLDLYKDIKTMPGNQLKGKGNTTFIQEHTLAMFAGYSGPFTSLAGSTDVNWDMVTYPYFTGAKPVAMEVESHPLAISKSSKHPQEAFNVISLLTDQEAQVAMTQRGRLSSLKDEAVKKQFAASFPALKNKNVQAVFKHSPAPAAPFSLYDDIVSTELKKAADDYVKGSADVNTILRKAEETANQKIAAEKTGK
jgi:multiple sugar transport system substrate-binding protein